MATYPIITKAARAKLKPRRDPYWHQLGPGCFIGFRRLSSGDGTWIARFRDRAGKQHFKSLGAVPEFTDAKAGAERWYESMGAGTYRTIKRGTVREAVTAYIAQLLDDERADAAIRAQNKFETALLNDPIADMRLEDTSRDDWRAWRQRVRTEKKRAPATVNRYVKAVVAALNKAVNELGHVGNPLSWKFTHLSGDASDTGENAVYLDRDQRGRILKYASPELQLFLRALWASAGRPQELAIARVRDYDATTNVLVLRHMKGKPAKWRPRSVSLDMRDAQLFKELSMSKLPGAYLLVDDHAKPWSSHNWAKHFRAAVAAANEGRKAAERIPVEHESEDGKRIPGANAYSFRHAKISEMLQLDGIDPLTVSHAAGTGLEMMRKYYWKFIPAAMRAKLGKSSSAVA